MDLGLFRIEPATLAVRVAPDGPYADELHISRLSIQHLVLKPEAEALTWCWDNWKHSSQTT